ncbi:M6 family metalloprotease domain protein [Pelomyxa schiedti]|nr:M6 family metalloprotease domain protein [Pelomyxa schiedti]
MATQNARRDLRNRDDTVIHSIVCTENGQTFYEDFSGHTIVLNSDGYWCIARLTHTGELAPSPVRVSLTGADVAPGVATHLRPYSLLSIGLNMANRRIVSGELKGLCLPVKFLGEEHGPFTTEDIEAFFNDRNYTGFGNNGSVFEYFYYNSGKRLNYTCRVTPYYTTRHVRDHYTTLRWPAGIRELAREVIEHFQAHDPRVFDGLARDSSEYVRAINILYTGDKGRYRQGLWPCAISLDPPVPLNYGSAKDYNVCNMGYALSLGCFCHENGHMLCDFPDLYFLQSPSKGVGKFCLMSSFSDTCPAQVCTHLKLLVGWEESLDIMSNYEMEYSLSERQFACIENPNFPEGEYFILENRQRVGPDRDLPGSGLLVWLIKRGIDNQDGDPKAWGCRLIQADNRDDLETGRAPSGASDMFRKTTFSPSRMRHATWGDRTQARWTLAVSGSGPTMYVSLFDRDPVTCTEVAFPDHDHPVVRRRERTPGCSCGNMNSFWGCTVPECPYFRCDDCVRKMAVPIEVARCVHWL